MDCSFIKKNLFAILENTLSADDRSETDLHLKSCSDCNHLLSGFLETMSVIDTDKSKEINPFMSTRIIQRIDSVVSSHVDKKQKEFLRLLQPIVFTFTLFLAVLIGFSLGKTGMNSISGKKSDVQGLQSLRSELFISDITDEDKTLFLNP
jgi:hypothetical protein